VPSEKRARQRAARETRLAQEARAKKRRKQIRNIVVVVVIAGVIIGIVFLTTSNSPKKAATSTTTTTTSTTSTTTSSTTTSSTTASTPSTIATIPTADRSPVGTAGKAPTVIVPSGSAPTQLESADLITGTGATAAPGDSLTVQYVLATYSSRKVVQSSWTSKAFTFTLSTGNVIAGWVQGVVGMKVGGRRELIIPPSLGYGAKSPGTGIAANDTLVFVIDLLKVG